MAERGRNDYGEVQDSSNRSLAILSQERESGRGVRIRDDHTLRCNHLRAGKCIANSLVPARGKHRRVVCYRVPRHANAAI